MCLSTGRALFLVSVVSALQTVSYSLPANADEMVGSLKDTPVSVAPETWTGAYFGMSVGYGHNRSKNNYTDTDPTYSSVSETAKGGLVSFSLGYDRQISDRFLIGAFADFDLSDLDRGNHSAHNALTIDSAWAVGGRLGYLVRPDLMVFATGGYTEAHFDNDGWWDIYANGVGPLLPGKSSVDFRGYFVGGGVEARVRDNLYLKGELRYADYGERVTNSGSFHGTDYVDKEDPSVFTARVGLAYKLNRDRGSSGGGWKDEPGGPSAITYTGAEVADGDWSIYSGALVALNGDLGRDGLVLRSEGVYASYDVDAGAAENSDVRDRSGDIMLGYQHYFGSVSAAAYAGYEIRDIKLSPDVSDNSLRGTKSGFKVATEIETGDEDPLYVNFLGTYSTAFDAIWGQLRVGYNTQGFIVGPEVEAWNDDLNDATRIGAFVKTSFNLLPQTPTELTLNGGYQFEGDLGQSDDDGYYLGTTLKFNF